MKHFEGRLIIPVTTMTHDELLRFLVGKYPFLVPSDVVINVIQFLVDTIQNHDFNYAFSELEESIFINYYDDLVAHLRDGLWDESETEKVKSIEKEPIDRLVTDIANHLVNVADFFGKRIQMATVESTISQSEVALMVYHVAFYRSGIRVMLGDYIR